MAVFDVQATICGRQISRGGACKSSNNETSGGGEKRKHGYEGVGEKNVYSSGGGEDAITQIWGEKDMKRAIYMSRKADVGINHRSIS